MRLALVALLFAAACSDPQMKLKLRDEACKTNRDCVYGLDCVDTGVVAAAVPDGGALADGGPAQATHTCQFHSFGDCEGDGSQPAPDGQPQCLNSYKCRDGHCTVQCASHKDCKEGETCKVGSCQKGTQASNQCADNRDCPYPETCYYGQCVTRLLNQRCNTDLDCGPGYRCINAVCQ